MNTTAEAFVLEWLLENQRADHLVNVEAQRAAKVQRVETATTVIEQELRSLRQSREKEVNLYRAGVHDSIEKLQRELAPIDAAIAAAEESLRQAKITVRVNRQPPADVFGGILSLWKKATEDERRDLLRPVISKIVVKRGRWVADKLTVVPVWAAEDQEDTA
jgi:hypothetical protein